VLSEPDRTSRLVTSLNSAMDDPEANLAVLFKKLGTVEAKAAELTEQKESLSAKVANARAKSEALYRPIKKPHKKSSIPELAVIYDIFPFLLY
jgi:phage shock protein A